MQGGEDSSSEAQPMNVVALDAGDGAPLHGGAAAPAQEEQDPELALLHGFLSRLTAAPDARERSELIVELMRWCWDEDALHVPHCILAAKQSGAQLCTPPPL